MPMQRKSPRLKGFDYTTRAAYFVTICTYQRLPLFGEIIDGVMRLAPSGEIAAACWQAISNHYPGVILDEFVIMPNHMHGLLGLTAVTSDFRTALGWVINSYKGAVTTRIRQQSSPDMKVWQSRYYDHIVRDEADLDRIREYVQNNPLAWSADRFHPGGP